MYNMYKIKYKTQIRFAQIFKHYLASFKIQNSLTITLMFIYLNPNVSLVSLTNYFQIEVNAKQI